MSETNEHIYPLPFLGPIDTLTLTAALAPRLRDRFGIKEFQVIDWSLDTQGRYPFILRPQDIRMGIRIVVVRYSTPAPNQPALP